jgi:hypothetical protein
VAEVARPQIRPPVALSQLQIANDRSDAEPFFRRQFLPWHLQTHAALSGQYLYQERRKWPHGLIERNWKVSDLLGIEEQWREAGDVGDCALLCSSPQEYGSGNPPKGR